MSDPEPGSVSIFLQQLHGGDAEAAAGLWSRLFPRLLGLARRTLGSRPQRAADADDAVQSAFASFFQRASDGQFSTLANRNDLWKLLGVMTVRKSLKQARHERAARRGGGVVLDEAALGADGLGPARLEQLAANMPTQEFDLRCAELLETLDDELRHIAVLRLMGHLNREIAAQLGCTERKVERKLQLIRLQWEGELDE